MTRAHAPRRQVHGSWVRLSCAAGNEPRHVATGRVVGTPEVLVCANGSCEFVPALLSQHSCSLAALTLASEQNAKCN